MGLQLDSDCNLDDLSKMMHDKTETWILYDNPISIVVVVEAVGAQSDGASTELYHRHSHHEPSRLMLCNHTQNNLVSLNLHNVPQAFDCPTTHCYRVYE